jgi:hypothetical protein
VGRLPSTGSVSCCRHGALAYVDDVFSQPGWTRIVHGSVLQLRKDLVQPAAWPLRGEQHRQVHQPPALWGHPSCGSCALSQRHSAASVRCSRSRGTARSQSASVTEVVNGASRILVVIVHQAPSPLPAEAGAPIRSHSGQSLTYKGEGLAVGPRSGSRDSCQSQATLEATARLIRNSTRSAVFHLLCWN